MKELNFVKINEKSWDRWVEEKCIWTLPISHQEFIDAQRGVLELYLTPLTPVPQKWFSPLKDKKILGLASGGGQQCPLFAAGGAEVTLLDNSSNQLKLDELVAKREHYKISLIKGDMTERFPFNDESFDLIFHPISNSYIENVSHIWQECYRVLKHGGKLLAGFANPTIYLYTKFANEYKLTYSMPFNPFKDLSEEEMKTISNIDGIQFGHSFSDQITAQLNAGFIITGFYEDYHPLDNSLTNYNTYIGETAAYLSKYMPVYFATESIKF